MVYGIIVGYLPSVGDDLLVFPRLHVSENTR